MEEYIPEEFEEKVVQINRVSKKTAGGNKIGFSVLMVVGNKNGRVGVGLGKAPSVQDAIKKGSSYAKKHLIRVPMVETTIPHEIYIKRGAAKVLLKPAAKGTGVIAGGAVRAVVDAAGIKDILSKVLGTNNQASNVYATLEALRQLRSIERPAFVEKKIEKAKKTDKEKEPVIQAEGIKVKAKISVKTTDHKKTKTKSTARKVTKKGK